MIRPQKGIENNIILTEMQKKFLRDFKTSDLKIVYRITGGTALSAFYLEHRLSEDLDFFSSEKVPAYVIENYLKTLDYISKIRFTKSFDMNIYHLYTPGDSILRVEFTYYPFENIEKAIEVDDIYVDSIIDILVNKICAIADRIDIKDYVDLYSGLLAFELSLENLVELAEEKCGIRGIRHIIQRRLLDVPEGIEKLKLTKEVDLESMKTHFEALVESMVEREVDRFG